ncbi:hypothetical protein L6164_030793 [Bauhinia variegata]|uniref:Uncharacterized protein n=1 Tax=Bauhinia variegata TaxID=167791 RepID=A0ACB9LCZ7_BAUVA|nr:hypothetical protein L6164_030793 [Bauhinia variegata]
MSRAYEYESSKIETFVLKLYMNCQGSMNKAKRLLREIEGVYKLEINAEEEKVTVTGIVDPSTLVQKLVNSGKHVEIWNESFNQEQVNYDKDNLGHNQDQILKLGSNAYDSQYHWAPEWYLNQDMSGNNVVSELHQPVAADQNYSRISDHKTWEERLTHMMSPATFHGNYIGFPFPRGSSIFVDEYDHPPSLVAITHRYHHNCQPSTTNRSQLYYHNHLYI